MTLEHSRARSIIQVGSGIRTWSRMSRMLVETLDDNFDTDNRQPDVVVVGRN